MYVYSSTINNNTEKKKLEMIRNGLIVTSSRYIGILPYCMITDHDFLKVYLYQN